jgi:hypothetical protein
VLVFLEWLYLHHDRALTEQMLSFRGHQRAGLKSEHCAGIQSVVDMLERIRYISTIHLIVTTIHLIVTT